MIRKDSPHKRHDEFLAFTIWVSLLPQLLFRQLRQVGKRGASVVVKIWSSQDDGTCLSNQELSPRNSQLSKFISEPLPHLTFPKSSSIPKASSVWSHTLPFWDFYLPEVFSVPKVFNPKSKAWISVHWDLCLPLRSSILPTFTTCNAHFSAGRQWWIS